jgi:sugar/nucleoside kinase (ribokinase family)
MNTFLGCSTELGYDAIDPIIIGESQVLLLEGYMFDRPEVRAAFRRALSLARESAKRVALSLPDTLCIERHRRELVDLVRSGVYLLIANERKVMSLYQTGRLDEAVSRLIEDIAYAAVTRGANGSLIVAKGHCITIPAEPVQRVIDMTGTGDFYAAGLLFGLSRGLDLVSAGRLGSFAAAEIISHFGARPTVNLGHLARLRGLID